MVAKRDPLERAFEKVVPNAEGCLVWQGPFNHRGYGLIRAGRTRAAHRLLYETFVGPVPDGKQVDHICRNRACVNWFHLQPVTPQINTLRGNRHMRPRRYCKRGHEFTRENTYINPKAKSRVYVICLRVRSKARWKKINA